MAAAGFRAALLALICAGCTSIHADRRTFEGTNWQVTAINGVRTPPYRIWFGGGYMRGDICNRFEGPFKVARDVLQLTGFMATERGCPGPPMRFEESAFAILHRPMRMRWGSGRRLTLSNGAGAIALHQQGALK